jgi:hypothetical protein
MGVLTSAYFGYQLDEEVIYRFCNDLNSYELATVGKFIKKYNDPKDNKKVWNVLFDDYTETFELTLNGLQFIFAEKVCFIRFPIYWSFFLTEDDVQNEIREITCELLNYFKSPFVIYVPDNGFRESGIMDFIWKEDEEECKDIYYIQNWLMTVCGPPKKNIKDIFIQHDDYWHSEGYFIDEFYNPSS